MKKKTSKKTNQTVPWNGWVGVFLAIFIFIIAQVLSGVVLSIYALSRHYTTAQANSLTNSIPVQFIDVLIIEGVVIFGIVWFARRREGGLASIGIKKPKINDFWYGVLAYIPFVILELIVLVIATHLFHINENNKQNVGFNSTNITSHFDLFLTFISLVILPPLGEEILFRGMLYSSFKKLFSVPLSVIFTCSLFAAGHLPEGTNGLLWVAAIDTFCLSLVLIYLREKTGRVWANVTLHSMNNLIAFISLYHLLF